MVIKEFGDETKCPCGNKSTHVAIIRNDINAEYSWTIYFRCEVCAHKKFTIVSKFYRGDLSTFLITNKTIEYIKELLEKKKAKLG